tara:strand:+ start:172 stop:1257 length:1086 start_codon:yes stop_codon:yes gene_type:complete
MKIAFCKFAGLGSGGIEKYLQSLALLLKEVGHDIDFYYTNAAPLHGTSWVHPPNDAKRVSLMSKNEINVIKVNVGYRVHNTWFDTDFFSVFDEDKYDFLITAGNGEPEYPYIHLNKVPILHSVHGDHVFDQENIVKSFLICDWQAERWLQNGGDKSKLEIIPNIVQVPSEFSTNFREKHSIPQDAFVFGMHQRNDPTIFSSASLEAFRNLDCGNAYYALLGGSDHHRNYVEGWESNKKNKVLFLDFTSDTNEIHSFLDALDVYAHCRRDGEVSSSSIVEAMYHSKPIVSCPGQNNGHYNQIKNCGFFCNSLEEYVNAMKTLQKDTKKYKDLAKQALSEYNKMYSYDAVSAKVMSLIDGARL